MISLWLLKAMRAQQGLQQGEQCHRDRLVWLGRTSAATPARLGCQMESSPAASSTRHGEGRGAMVSPPRILNRLLSRQISRCSQPVCMFFLLENCTHGHRRALRVSRGVEGLLFSAGALHSEEESRAGCCGGGND